MKEHSFLKRKEIYYKQGAQLQIPNFIHILSLPLVYYGISEYIAVMGIIELEFYIM